MAVHVRDGLAEYLGENTFTSRHDNWLFTYLCQIPGSTIALRAGGMTDLRLEILKELERQKISKEHVIDVRYRCTVPKSYFDWFEDTDRFYRFFMRHQLDITDVVKNNLLNLNIVELCVLIVDSSKMDLQQKLSKLSTEKGIWLERKSIGRKFEWVSGPHQEKKAELAYMAAKEARPTFYFSENVCSLDDLLIYADSISLSDWEAKSASETARRRFSQFKYREESKDKKQLNVLVEIECIKRLNNLSRKHKLSKAKIVEMLINIESEKHAYISEKNAAWLRGDIS